jgi:predicted YcjX-like family ATPase
MMKHVRVGITGLSRAGKTVFLTSTLYNLLETTGAHLPIFAKNKVRFCGREHSSDSNCDSFPYEANLERYRSDHPDWPSPTTGITEFSVNLVLNRHGRRMQPARLTFVDYPGEKLHDLPLANQSFGTWSKAALGSLRTLPPSHAKLAFETAISSARTLTDVSGDGDPTNTVASAYRSFCIAARDVGIILPPVDAGMNLDPSLSLPFFPLPAEMQKSHPLLWQATAKKYDAYLSESVSPFLTRVSGCNHQIVLVDILGILKKQDPNEFNRARKAISDILRSFRYLNHGNRRWVAPLRRATQDVLSTLRICQPRIQQVAFVCTKADQAAAGSRRNLLALLQQLVDQAATEIRFQLGSLGRISYHFSAAHRCTKDSTTEYQGQKLSVLVGRLKECTKNAEEPIFPGEVPTEWPTTSTWEGFRFPDFAPRILPAINGASLDHINLDEILFGLAYKG